MADESRDLAAAERPDDWCGCEDVACDRPHVPGPDPVPGVIDGHQLGSGPCVPKTLLDEARWERDTARAEADRLRARLDAGRALCADSMRLPTAEDPRPADDRVSPRAVLVALTGAETWEEARAAGSAAGGAGDTVPADPSRDAEHLFMVARVASGQVTAQRALDRATNHGWPPSVERERDYVRAELRHRSREYGRASAEIGRLRGELARVRADRARVGRCGHTPPQFGGPLADRLSCTLPAGHAGFHEDDTRPGSSWGRMHTDPDVEAALAARTATPPAELSAECGRCPIVPMIQMQHGCPVHEDDWPAAPDVAAGDPAAHAPTMED